MDRVVRVPLWLFVLMLFGWMGFFAFGTEKLIEYYRWEKPFKDCEREKVEVCKVGDITVRFEYRSTA